VFLFLIGRIPGAVPAEPKLGPVYQHVTHFVPPEFPLLLIVPALALDLMWQRTGHWGRWKQSIVSGIVFLVALAAASGLRLVLMSPAARNWFDRRQNTSRTSSGPAPSICAPIHSDGNTDWRLLARAGIGAIHRGVHHVVRHHRRRPDAAGSPMTYCTSKLPADFRGLVGGPLVRGRRPRRPLKNCAMLIGLLLFLLAVPLAAMSAAPTYSSKAWPAPTSCW